MADLWYGVSFSASASSEPYRLLMDALLTTVIIYLFLSIFPENKGKKLVILLLLCLITVALSWHFSLFGVLAAAKTFFVVLIIAIPVLLYEEWTGYLLGVKKVGSLKKSWRLALALMIGVAAVIISNGTSVRTAVLPESIVVSSTNTKPGLSANFGAVDTAKVIITAPRGTFAALNDKSFSATVDIGQREEGTYDLPIVVTSKISGVTVRGVKPDRVVVTVEPIIRKTVPVVMKYNGKADQELVPDSPIIDKDKVEVQGPRSVIQNLTQATAVIDISRKSADFESEVELAAFNSANEQIRSVEFEPKVVKVTTRLVKAGRIKTVPIKVAIQGNVASGYWISAVTAEPSTVAITGTPDVLEQVVSISTKPVSVNSVSSTATITTELELPSGATLATNSSRVAVTITVSDNVTTKQITPTIEYDGLATALKVASLNPTSVQLVVSGSSQQLSSISSSARLKLRLSAYKSAGVYSVAIVPSDITLPEGVTIVSYLPSAIDVTLENR